MLSPSQRLEPPPGAAETQLSAPCSAQQTALLPLSTDPTPLTQSASATQVFSAVRKVWTPAWLSPQAVALVAESHARAPAGQQTAPLSTAPSGHLLSSTQAPLVVSTTKPGIQVSGLLSSPQEAALASGQQVLLALAR